MPSLPVLLRWLAVPIPALLVLTGASYSGTDLEAGGPTPPSPDTFASVRAGQGGEEPTGPNAREQGDAKLEPMRAVQSPALLDGQVDARAAGPAGADAAPRARPTATRQPEGGATPAPGETEPAHPLIVSFYGYPNVPQMGALGEDDPATTATRLEAVAEAFEPLARFGVTTAFHLIVAVAQEHATADGTYLGRLSDQTIREYVETARSRQMLVFLDVQVGWSSALTEVLRLEEFLIEPFVHVALDPEFATRGKNEAPGAAIGFLDADDINAVQKYLADLTAVHDLPPKMLVVHQFLDRMIRRAQSIESVAGVDLIIDMDGFGSPSLKTHKYERHALAAHAELPAIKLFYAWDSPLMSPADVMSLAEPPMLVIYQ